MIADAKRFKPGVVLLVVRRRAFICRLVQFWIYSASSRKMRADKCNTSEQLPQNVCLLRHVQKFVFRETFLKVKQFALFEFRPPFITVR
jgi:hypothetical protein